MLPKSSHTRSMCCAMHWALGICKILSISKELIQKYNHQKSVVWARTEGSGNQGANWVYRLKRVNESSQENYIFLQNGFIFCNSFFLPPIVFLLIRSISMLMCFLFFFSKSMFKGSSNDSVNKGVCCQIWQPEFNT